MKIISAFLLSSLYVVTDVQARTGCFNGPMIGTPRANSIRGTIAAKPWCRIKRITTCDYKDTSDGNVMCSMKQEFDNCSSIQGTSKFCETADSQNKGQNIVDPNKVRNCVTSNVSGELLETQMFESTWKTDGKPQPSGFRAKFSKTGWTNLHGTKKSSLSQVQSEDNAIFWKATYGADSGKAYWGGASFGFELAKAGAAGENGERLNYLDFFICDGAQISSASDIALCVRTTKQAIADCGSDRDCQTRVQYANKNCNVLTGSIFNTGVPKKLLERGCFNGPVAGKFNASTSTVVNDRAQGQCRISKIKSCNQKNTSNGPIWCYLKMSYTGLNCKAHEHFSSECANPTARADCREENVTGDINQIWMYQANYQGNSAVPVPSGFQMKFGRKWTQIFGSKGNGNPKTWSSAEVLGGRAELFGVEYDKKGQADFLSFHMCQVGGVRQAWGQSATAMATKGASIATKLNGCFDAPISGKYVRSTSIRQTARVAQYCKIREIASCGSRPNAHTTNYNGPTWCSTTMKFTNCESVTVKSDQCTGGISKADLCVSEQVDGDITDVWMYESNYQGKIGHVMPTGFYLRFSNSGWTKVFGSIGSNKPKKWSAKKDVSGGRAQLMGVTYDSKGVADFFGFHLCAGPLLDAPPPQEAKREIATIKGCFNTPMAGQENKNTKPSTQAVPKYCKVNKITSCNQKDESNGPIWCYLRMGFTNCPDSFVAGEECKGGKNLGKCVSSAVDGGLQEVWMYESLYQQKRDTPMPSGFYLKFAQSSWTPLFGSRGTNEPKKWSVGSVIGGEAQLFGVRFDTVKQVDFLQFYGCRGGLSKEPIVRGCTDPAALNYNKKANTDDKSCKFPVLGCMDSIATNYNRLAVKDDGSCKYIVGCTIKDAVNYNPKATKKANSTCKFIRGCMIASALNYNKKATRNDGSCKFPKAVAPVYGCTDKLASNYNPKATRENGSCKFIIIKKKPSGCFNGPYGGQFIKKTSKRVSIKSNRWCRIVRIKSCNQAYIGNGPMWCYMKMVFDPRDNCPDLVAKSGECINAAARGYCKEENVTGDLNEIWMYSAYYKNKSTNNLQPSGFHLRFGNKWTNLFGDVGTDKPNKWSARSVFGERAQLFGISWDSYKQADFLQFYYCTGGLAALPIAVIPDPVKPPVVVDKRQNGCFDGPMAGNFKNTAKNQDKQTFKSEAYCKLREITSCNQKDTKNGPIWCSIKFAFTNCPDKQVVSGYCAGNINKSKIGICHTEKVDGDIDEINMYESYYGGRGPSSANFRPMPSGFSLKFRNSGYTNLFGSVGNRAKKWTPKNVVGQRAQLYGVTVDTEGQADFLAFRMCAGGLSLAPSPDAVSFVVPTQTGCFRGPRAGKYDAAVAYTNTNKVDSWCRIKEITSCNQKNISNGPIWCYLKTSYHNCPDQISNSGECNDQQAIGDCTTAQVRGSITEIQMYESLYRGQPDVPMPSGFYLKFTDSSWSPLFGSTGTKTPKKWKVSSVVGGEAQLLGVIFDAQNQANFMQFWICQGPLTAKPLPPKPAPVVCKPGYFLKNNKCFLIPIKRQCGCFNGPQGGKFRTGVANLKTMKSKAWCKASKITSWNQKNLANGPIWCQLRIQYFNCAELIVRSGACKDGKKLGKSVSDNVNGDLNEIWMYESNYQNKANYPMPSGFYLKFGKQWTKLFGSTGLNQPKKWQAKTGACGGRAQLAGATFDTSGQADSFQFHLCSGPLADEPKIPGCMDRKARNYNALATKDNGSCIFWIDGCMNKKAKNYNKKATRDTPKKCTFWVVGCMDKKAKNYNKKADKAGACTFWVVGCMDKKARNYNKKADKAGACTFWVDGCMDKKARNYNKLATRDNKTCIFWIDGCMDKKARNYNKKATRDNKTCIFWIPGCMDKTATNYSAKATKDNGSCKYIGGCTIKTARNYNPKATKANNASCIYWIPGCMDKTATNFNAKATKDNGSCTHIIGCMDKKARNYDKTAIKADNSKCIYWIPGCMDKSATNFNAGATKDNGSCTYIGGCMVKTARNYNPKATKANNASCKYWIPGCMNKKATNFNALATKDNGTCVMPKVWVLGCTDPKATNYDKAATKDNGTCKIFVKPVKAKCWLSAVAGCFHPKTSQTRTKDVPSTCQLTQIDSCNSPITHSDNWCWMKMKFANCKSIEMSSGMCKKPSTRGKCNQSKINGNIIRIDLHSDYWKGNKKEVIPSGFSVYTDKNSSARFGTVGKETKTWKGRGRIVGASYDVSGESDFLQFKICNDDSWWKKPAPVQTCQGQNIAAKSVIWAADLLGVKCDGSTTGASTLAIGASTFLAYFMLF